MSSCLVEEALLARSEKLFWSTDGVRNISTESLPSVSGVFDSGTKSNSRFHIEGSVHGE